MGKQPTKIVSRDRTTVPIADIGPTQGDADGRAVAHLDQGFISGRWRRRAGDIYDTMPANQKPVAPNQRRRDGDDTTGHL